ncbi:MAG: SPOR domain-containing protein [Burkholderiales bacterium]|nr:SPOR domain-containing protein [Burkholderiales bacterium]
MIRTFVLILLLVNLALYAWMRYGPPAASPEAQLVDQQISPESIRLLPPESAEGKPIESSEHRAAAPAAGDAVACVEWGAFQAAEVARARKAVAAIDAAARVSERRIEEPAGWWVFIPPQASRQAANQKVAELRTLGLAGIDYFIVQDDSKLRFAVSLGVFRTEDGARNRLAQLREKGVRTAQVDRRTAPVRRTYLRLQDLPVPAREKLDGLTEEFPGSELRECGAAS